MRGGDCWEEAWGGDILVLLVYVRMLICSRAEMANMNEFCGKSWAEILFPSLFGPESRAHGVLRTMFVLSIAFVTVLWSRE